MNWRAYVYIYMCVCVYTWKRICTPKPWSPCRCTTAHTTGKALADVPHEDGHGRWKLRFPAGLMISHHEVSANQRCEVGLDRFLSWHHCQTVFFSGIVSLYLQWWTCCWETQRKEWIVQESPWSEAWNVAQWGVPVYFFPFCSICQEPSQLAEADCKVNLIRPKTVNLFFHQGHPARKIELAQETLICALRPAQKLYTAVTPVLQGWEN